MKLEKKGYCLIFFFIFPEIRCPRNTNLYIIQNSQRYITKCKYSHKLTITTNFQHLLENSEIV